MRAVWCCKPLPKLEISCIEEIIEFGFVYVFWRISHDVTWNIKLLKNPFEFPGSWFIPNLYYTL